jgi:hypothetical protein
MADDRHYVPGSFYRICDRTGFKIRAGRTRKEWTTHIVRDASYEARQPQDLVRGVPDLQSVPEPRPRSTDVFLVTQTTLATNLRARAVAGTLDSILNVQPGDTLSIMLDNGENAIVIVQSLTGGTGLTWIPPLPWTASKGAIVQDRSVGALDQPTPGPKIIDQGNRPIVQQQKNDPLYAPVNDPAWPPTEHRDITAQ